MILSIRRIARGIQLQQTLGSIGFLRRSRGGYPLLLGETELNEINLAVKDRLSLSALDLFPSNRS